MQRALSVYLVEDSAILLGLLRRLLEAEQGIEVVGHSDSAATAVEELRILDPDVVVIDLALREGNGFDVLKAAREMPEAPLPVVLTNHTSQTYREAAARLGVDRFYDKSSEISALCRYLRELAESRRAAS